jgi:hypothetical protein
MRVVQAVLSVLLAAGALALVALPRSESPPDLALRRDPANAYRWADLAEAYQAAGDIPRARLCFQRALQLGPYILPVWIRDANFLFQLGDSASALHASARVLATVPDYDAILFSYFDRLADPDQVLAAIGSDRRATVSYLRHFIDSGNQSAAAVVWTSAVRRNYVDDPLASSYLDFLLRGHFYDEASEAWTAYKRTGPRSDLLFNGSFELPLSGAAFDWRIQTSPRFDTARENAGARDGKWCVHIAFHGDDNVSYENVMQTARVRPGSYRLSAWVRTRDITTNEGLRLRVFDPESPARLDLRTDSLTGTRPWTLVQLPFIVPPQTNLITVELYRVPSLKFDNKIAGSAWVDDVHLTK